MKMTKPKAAPKPQPKMGLLRTPFSRQAAVLLFPALLLLLVMIIGVTFQQNQQFTLLAKAFLHGKLYFLQSIGGVGQDPVYWHGHVYWSEGPFPSLLLLPFVGLFGLFHVFFYQGYLQWLLVLGVFGLVYGLARRLAYRQFDSLILAFGFTLGSVFIGVASISASWFFAQVVATALLLWGLYESYRPERRRWWLLGLICALVLLTRATAIPIIAFFALELWREAGTLRQKWGWLLQLGLPLVGAFAFIGVYNYLRFGSPLKGGYADQVLFPASLESESYGVFSLIHIPTNLYSALLRAPTPVTYDTTSWTLKFPYIKNNIYGMSMFVTSPYLLYLFTQKWSQFDTHMRHLLVATLLSALLVVSYFGVGLEQFGYRYALDFLPGLFLLFMLIYKKQHARLSKGMIFLLLATGFSNFYLLCPLIFG